MLLTFVLIFSGNTFAQTEISGTINGDSTTVWALAESPYIITGSTTITDADTISIENGVEVRFADNTQLTINGSLIGDGISFTANVGSGRDTWNRIYLNDPDSRLTLSNTTIQFADNGIEVNNGIATLEDVTISDSNRGLVVNHPGEAALNSVNITSTNYPIYFTSEGAITYEGTNDFTGNDNDMIYASVSTVDNNWTLGNPGIPYYISSSMQVYAGDTLTIDSGNILKFYSNNEVYTQDGGVIYAVADEGEVIEFTSWKNDNIGGDTNNDGSATGPTNTDWNGLRAVGNSATSTFKRVSISYAGYQNTSSGDFRGGITLINNQSEIDSSEFQNNLYGTVLRNGSDAIYTNNTIGTSGVVPVALTFDSNPTFTNNSFSSSNNEYDAIGLIGTTISGSNTVPKRDFTSIPNVTYLLLRELYVDTGATLTIEEGVVIKSTSYGIRVKGTLISEGTADDKIVFTSVKDDNIGNPNDTNKDGNNTVPGNSDWRGIAFGEDAGASIIDHNRIRYASYNTSLQYNEDNNTVSLRGAISIMNSDVTISNTEIANTNYYGIDSRGTANPVISNNSFSNTGSVPVALDLSSDPTFSGNTLANVGLIAIGYHGGDLTADGIIRAREFAGYENITSVLLASATVKSGSTLSIEPGTVVKVADNSSRNHLRIEGALKAEGTADSTIYFTSIVDDQIGNPLDTNGDGGATSPSSNDWGTIRFMGTSDDVNSAVTHTELRYNKHGMIFTDAAPTVDNVTILSCEYMGFGIESGSTVHISNSTIQNCGYDPVAISTNSNPTFSNIVFNSNGSNGISLLESNSFSSSTYAFNTSNYFYDTRNTVSADATVEPYAFAGYDNLPFIMRQQWSIGENTILSINPSVVFKGNVSLYVDGAIKTFGTQDDPVIFTSISDDGAGGDSNNDGNNTVPSPGQSVMIYFRSSSIETENHINYTEFRYPSTAIEFQSSEALVENSLFQLSSGNAINIYDNSSPEIRNNRFENIGNTSGSSRRHSIYMDMFSNPDFSGNVESNVSKKGLAIRGGNWGSDATVPFRSFAGTDSITYMLYGNFTIPSGSKIIIPAGMVFKSHTRYGTSRTTYGSFTVEGALKIEGTESSPVVFTSDTDDSFGQPADIYNDGEVNDTYRNNNSWLTFTATSDDTSNIITHAIFKNKNEAIVTNSADPTIRNSRFEDVNYGIELTGVSAPYVENNVFHNLDRTPLLVSLVSYPQTSTGNIMSGTTWKAIGVRTETLVQDVNLPKRDFAGKIGIPYYMSGTYTVGSGAVLTIDPGVIMKFEGSRGLNVEKGLLAEGRNHPDSLIVFTHIYDDFYGGDTNSDSNETQGGTWYGITYTATSLSEESKLDYTVIKNVSTGTNTAGVLADNSSPTITNSTIFNNGQGVTIWGSGNPVINNNDIYDNSSYGVFNRDETFDVDATNNWWGDDSGPTHAGNASGTGDEVSDAVNYSPFQGSGATKPVLGDVSLNGKVQSFDASGLLKHVAQLDTLNATQLAVADVSGNGTVSSMDASYILQYVVGLIEAFPAELASKARSEVLAGLSVENIKLELSDLKDLGDNEYKISLALHEVQNLMAFEIDLGYDSNMMEIIGVETGEILSGATLNINIENSDNVYLAMASAEEITSDGNAATIHFKLKDEKATSSINISRFIANEVDMSSTAVSNEEVKLNMPEQFELYQNYPNPFNPTTVIGFDISEANVKVTLKIFNVLGQEVATLANDNFNAGRHSVIWDGKNDAGMQVSTGVYIYRIQAGDIVQSKKLTFIK
ncbi:MAG: right-handed parallel beta-helix repeat-containing protein [Balneolaceae bacterium]